MLALVQARMSSSRLPGKVLEKIYGRSILEHVVRRVESCSQISQVVVTTSTLSSDNPIERVCLANHIPIYRGDLNNVSGRLLACCKYFGAREFVRISGDSPLIDPFLITQAIEIFESGAWDVVTNVFPRTFPKGQSVELISVEALENSTFKASVEQLEHVTQFFYQNSSAFAVRNFTNIKDLSDINLSIDTLSDYLFIDKMVTDYSEYLDDPFFFNKVEICGR